MEGGGAFGGERGQLVTDVGRDFAGLAGRMAYDAGVRPSPPSSARSVAPSVALAWAWALLALGLLGCAPELLSPSLSGMSPRYGFNGEDTPVTIAGADLEPQLRAISAEEIDLGVDFELLLVNEALGPPVALRGLERIDGEQLRAWVPAGAVPGAYDLSLRRSGGGDRLADAFIVTDTRADHIEVRAPDLSLAVRDSARIDLQVVDPNGDDVALPLAVVVRAERLDGSLGGVWFEGGLEGQEALGDGRVRGSLSAGGKASLRLSSDEVQQLRVGVEGIDGDAFLTGLGAWISFEAGGVGGVLIELQPREGGVVAGEAQRVRLVLVDAFGNPTRGESAWLRLHETCPAEGRGYEDFVRVDDALLLDEVVITGATDPLRCPGNQLRAFGGAEVDALVGLSEPFAVQPGPLSRLSVGAALPEVIAGRQAQPLWIEALDAFGNPVPEAEGGLALRDTAGGLDSEAGVGGASCTSFFEGVAACDALLVRAAEGVSVRAEVVSGPGAGAAGESAPFDVRADAPQLLSAQTDGLPVRAGQPFALRLTLADTFGNPVLPTEALLSEVVVSDGSPELRCAPDGDPALGRLACTTARARPGVSLLVSLPGLGLSAISDRFDVLNGDLAVVELSLDSPGPLVAGDRLGIGLRGFDAFENPYLSGPTGIVSLSLGVGGLSLGSVSLDPLGEGALNPQIVGAADPQFVVAALGGVELGRSDGFTVQPAGWTRLELAVDAPWVELGAPMVVEVRATDVYGNTCDAVDAPLSLRSLGGLAPPAAGLLRAGLAELELRYGAAGLGDRLRAEAGSIQADSAPIDALDFGCADGPEAALALDGQASIRLCRLSGSTPVVSMSAGGAVPGAEPLGAWHFDVGEGRWARASSAFQSVSWRSEGAFRARAVVADAAGCASVAEAWAWVGAADGQPVGPVSLGASRGALSVEAAASASAVLTLEALDCLGDPAAGATLQVYADLGSLSAWSAPLDAPGDGLRLRLDADGRGAIGVDVLGAPGGADLTVRAGVSSGAAFGALTLPVSGDTVAPTVIEVSPAGQAGGAAAELSARMSEPLWPSSVTAPRAELRAADGSVVPLAALDLAEGGRLLRLVPAAPLPLDTAVWTLFLSGDLRDVAGSRLNGDGTGPRTDLLLSFGAVPNAAPALLSCLSSGDQFQPDGDPGLGALAERVALSATAEAPPARWRLSVWDSAGALVRVIDGLGLGASARLEWTGADHAGRLQPPGDYLLELVALDANWSASAPCEALVQLQAPFPTPVGWSE